MTDRTELRRLLLQIERDLAVQAGLKRLLAASVAVVEEHRADLRAIKSQIRRKQA